MPDYSKSIINTATEQVSELTQQGLQRWTNASGAIEAGTYTTDQLVSDALFAWTAGINRLWTFPFRIAARIRPTVIVAVPAGTTNHSRSIPVIVPDTGAGQPVCSALKEEAGRDPLPTANVTCSLNENRTALTFELKGVAAPINDAGRLYTGKIRLAGERIAMVRVTFT